MVNNTFIKDAINGLMNSAFIELVFPYPVLAFTEVKQIYPELNEDGMDDY